MSKSEPKTLVGSVCTASRLRPHSEAMLTAANCRSRRLNLAPAGAVPGERIRGCQRHRGKSGSTPGDIWG